MKRTEGNEENLEIVEIQRYIDEFKTKFADGTASTEMFLSMNDLENIWSELRNKTNEIYSHMICDLLSSVNESDLIRSKKATTKKEG